MKKRMIKAAFRRMWRLLRNMAAVVGAMMVLGAAGTDEFYANELRTMSPENLDFELAIGLLLLIPLLIHILRKKNV